MTENGEPAANRLERMAHRLAQVRTGEGTALAWSFGYFFCLLASYYILRPVRDEMGIRGGVEQLHWTFTATFLVMLLALPLFGASRSSSPDPPTKPDIIRFESTGPLGTSPGRETPGRGHSTRRLRDAAELVLDGDIPGQ